MIHTTPPPQPHHNLPPVSAYIHLPFCRKRCHYCDFPIVALGSSFTPPPEDDPRILNYTQLICREIEATKPECYPTPPLETVFFGGGTPSLVPPRLVSDIVEALRLKFGLCLDAEMSMEMDPGTFDAEKLKGLMELGVNRVSLGVQAFQEEMLRGCGRAHGVKEIYEAIETVKSCGVENWSVDLISSLPHQTPEMWEESLQLVIEAQPTHVSVYDLQVEQGTKFGILYTPGEFLCPLKSNQQTSIEWLPPPFLMRAIIIMKSAVTARLCWWSEVSRPRKMKEYMGYVQSLETEVVGCGGNSVDAKDVAMDVVMLSLRTARGLDLKPYVKSGHVVCLDEQRRPVTSDEFSSLLSKDDGIEERLAFVRLSDPDGFLLSNELISLAFQAIAP
ncbi:Oxygen-independent coproporphyrinogen-III oxidase-like protein sll1917 [Vitis vinifera]|uniref:Oxygen-independent coproporphyrinogen-III oxidase-like protein sll1917 n=1 Tax=Vitis vinifera TaxID=29760 RepID=A0A438FQ45_VITVI|nr:Oxygen-independent coproporphyrinogen-III oxidase-like protein sll1917 [Vitis vinifera]